ncbi:MAG TPA: LysR substrate-binding domain-containing protein [Rhodocyclaceae bacterium]
MNRRHITFRQLEIFAAVARQKSFTRAAELLHLTQPAVSLQMQKLAEGIGQPIVEVIGREVVLTPVGRALLETTAGIDDAWDRFAATVEAHGALQHGTLRVATVTTAKYFLPRMLGRFSHEHPGIDIELEVLNRERIIARLRDGLDDLYVMGVPPEEIKVVSDPFLDNELVVIAPADWKPPRHGRLQLADLAGERFILRETGSGTRRLIDNHLARAGQRLVVKLVLGSNEAIREAVAGGMGLAILSRHALPAGLAGGDIRIVDVEGFPLRGRWYVVHRADRRLSRPAEAFRTALLGEAGARCESV